MSRASSLRTRCFAGTEIWLRESTTVPGPEPPGGRERPQTGGVKCVPIPAQSPNCNPHAERFVKTVRTECLGHFVIFGERHLRHLVTEFIGHYLTERYHQGIGSQIIKPTPSPSNDNAKLDAIARRSRLGGLLNYYCRETITAERLHDSATHFRILRDAPS